MFSSETVKNMFELVKIYYDISFLNDIDLYLMKAVKNNSFSFLYLQMLQFQTVSLKIN